ncbi:MULTISPECIES: DUF3320 domain-containing protein [Nocardiaceae]|jgi:hypothetical protein|uniref:DUF3320 domain-containing protein n=1 Tax=Nocardiaceae TaxID=85025 RepID=UPI001E386CBF|nr:MULTISPECIES: DUF3320 domain-containing protein [Rhodococcus]MCC8929023.1 DUF3320 domain-containing protein [Rhodococcus sp. I2R]MCZ4278153.1 DUF3320 domain-containing protein [Rhodococcus yunnanensis]
MQDLDQDQNPFRTVVDGLSIEIHAHPAVNLALVHNGVPLITSVEIVNLSDTDVVDVKASVQLFGAGTELSPQRVDVHDGALRAGEDVVWSNYSAIVPPVPHLRGLNESHSATIAVTVSRLWGEDILLNAPIRVLAHNEWFNAPAFYDSLAAFVQPNTRAVNTVLDAASNLLSSATGDPSLGGYQKGPERAAQIAAGIYEALRHQQIRYINPPASFEDTGQKIRTTSQVLDERFGTCIDLSVTFAACLEAVGIRPVIWLIDGHSFAGFLRDESQLAHSTITEPNALLNLVESGRVVPVEAKYYDTTSAGTFKQAVADARRHFADHGALRGVIAISSARKDGVRPLPSLDEVAAVKAEPSSSVPMAADLGLPADLLDAQDASDLVLDSTDTAPPRVQKWKRSLLDLSTRNRLLNLKPMREVIDLHVPNSGLALLDDLVHAGTDIELIPHDELSSIHELQGARRAQDIDDATILDYLRDRKRIHAVVTKDTYAARLKHLQRTAHTMFEETGNANLYLTFGGLIHTTSSGKDARAPLFLLPVKVVGGSGRSQFKLTVDTTGVSTPNYCLVEWLRIKHHASIPALENPPLDEHGIDIDEALKGIRSALVEHNLDFRIDETASVAICQFGTFGMWKDLTDHWDILEQSPIVRHLTHSAGESFRDSRRPDGSDIESVPVHELDVPVPIPADGSQLRAVALAADGHTFVLEGPPGTGKSQTITNLIAHTLSQGKSVLFVAEKQAALDVVKKRLDAVGLTKFTLDLHGKNQSANAIRDQLKRAIEHSTSYNYRSWAAKLADVRSHHVPLDDYPTKIHQKNGVDHSLWSAYDTLLGLGDGTVATVPASFVGNPSVSVPEITRALQQFERAARSISISRDNPWTIAGIIDSQATDDHFRAVTAGLSTALDAVHRSPTVRYVVEQVPNPEAIEHLLPQARRQFGRPIPTADVLTNAQSAQWAASKQALLGGISLLQQQCGPLTSVFTPSFIASGDAETLALAAEDATKGLFGKKKRSEQFVRDLAPALLPGVQLDPESALPLLRSIPGARGLTSQTVQHMHQLLTQFAPPTWNPIAADATQQLQASFDYVEQTAHFVRTQPQLWQILTATGPLTPQDTDTLDRLAQAWRSWRQILGSTDTDIDRWRNNSHWFAAWQRDSQSWLEAVQTDGSAPIRQWSTMTAFLNPLRAAGLTDLVHELLTGTIPANQAEIAFMRGVARTSLSERRRKHGLSHFDRAIKDGQIDDFANASAASRSEQISALPAALLGRRSFQAGSLTGDVGHLRRALDAKRGGTTFRQLMNRYANYILEATPCFFVSPTSLAQFVPPGSVTFDLVVFDEASQVTVPQAIGALGRGRSAVIVGDSQQMPPTAIGVVSTNDSDDYTEDDEVIPDDLDSILTEAVESGVPRLWLSWHYRSQDESLIAFSNEKYYEGRLASLPSPGGDDTAGVEWRRVDGHFNRETKDRLRTNIVEAEAIVEEIRGRLANAHLASQSIGVVTFNAQQQTLVRDLLEASGDPLILDQLREDRDDGIFVKNLENVQGDERDVILFSAAFSKKPNDPKLPLNFGPLTRTGGEKRLNVAITRARRKVVIFTSFDPTDIDLSRTRSVGMAHLRGYLEHAAQDSRGEDAPAVQSKGATDEVQAGLVQSLRDHGYEVEANYGLSDFVLDLVVREPGSERWQVAVMLDGPQWAQRPTVADRDLTPQLLESMMHWGSSVRVWLPDWIDNPDSAISQVGDAVATSKERMAARQAEIDAAAEGQAAAIAVSAATEVEFLVESPEEFAPDAERWLKPSAEESREPEVMEPVLIARATVDEPALSLVQPRDWHGRNIEYVEASSSNLGIRDDLDRVHSPAVKNTILRAVQETVEIEGPISIDRLARNVARRFGFDRVAAARRDFVLQSVPEELIERSEALGDFVWPKELDRGTWRGFRRTPSDLARPLSDVAPEEIINAMMSVCARAGQPDYDSLLRQTLSTFNQKRLTGQTRERLETVIDLGVRRGRLIKIGETYRAGS